MSMENKIEKEKSNIKKAEEEFKNKCLELGVVPWKVNPKSKVDYSIGVSTNWPNKFDNLLLEKVNFIVDSGNKISEKYNLKLVYDGLHFAAGGAAVIYVGFKE